MKTFNSIEQLLRYRNKCFCGKSLKMILSYCSSNYERYEEIFENFLILNIAASLDLIDEYYCVKLKLYISYYNNKIYTLISKHSIKNGHTFLEEDLQLFFKTIRSRFEFRCDDCRYQIISDSLRLSDDLKYIMPFSIFENVEIDKYYIENNFYNETCSIKKVLYEPITINKNIDFADLNTDQLLNKIKTIISFS